MMRITRHVGGLYAVVFAGIGCLCALMLLFLLNGMGIFSKGMNTIGIVVGVLGLFFSAYIFGQWAGNLIATRSKLTAAFIGIGVALTVLEFSIITGSMVGFLSDRSPWGLSERFFTWVVKSMYWISLYGFIPVIILGAFYGLKVWNVLAERLNGPT